MEPGPFACLLPVVNAIMHAEVAGPGVASMKVRCRRALAPDDFVCAFVEPAEHSDHAVLTRREEQLSVSALQPAPGTDGGSVAHQRKFIGSTRLECRPGALHAPTGAVCG